MGSALSLIPIIGPFLGMAVRIAFNVAGQVLIRAGQFLMTQGTKLVKQGFGKFKGIFSDIKSQSFTDILKSFKDKFLDQINPLRNAGIGRSSSPTVDGIKLPGAGCTGLSFVSCGSQGGSLLTQILDPLKQKFEKKGDRHRGRGQGGRGLN